MMSSSFYRAGDGKNLLGRCWMQARDIVGEEI